MKSQLKWFKKSFLKIDIYGRQIKFKYQGQDTKKTYPGAFATILTILFVFTHFAFQLKDIFNNKFTMKSFNHPQDMTSQDINITQNQFDFGINIISPLYYSAESYLGYSLEQFMNISMIQYNKDYSSVYLGFQNCTNDRFLGDESFQNLSSVDPSYWNNIKCSQANQVMSLSGKQGFSYMYLMIGRCDQKYLESILPEKVCVSDNDVLNKFIEDTTFQFMYTRQYFDPQEFKSSPVKTKVETLDLILQETQMTSIDAQLQLLTALDLNSKIHDSLDSQEYLLTQAIISTVESAQNWRKNYLQIEFSIQNQYNHLERQMFNYVQAICLSGGLAGILIIFAKICLMPFIELIFYSSLMKSSFLIGKEFLTEQNLGNTDNFDSVLDSFKQKPIIDRYNLSNNKPEDYQRLAQKLNSRVKFKYSSLQFIKDSIFGCCLCSKKNKVTTLRQLFLYGKKKLDQSMDIKKVIYQLREYEILKNILLTRQQKKLLPFLQKNRIDKQFEKRVITVKKPTQIQKEEQTLNLILEHFSENLDPKNNFNKRIFENLVTQIDEQPTQERDKSLKQKMFTGIIKKCIRANTGILTKETKFESMKIKKGISQSFINEEEESYDQFMSKQNQNQMTSMRTKNRAADQSVYNLDDEADGQQAIFQNSKSVFKTYDHLPIDSQRKNKPRKNKIVMKAKTRIVKRPIELQQNHDSEI
ncbi:UNKNOWN [Stylonychia lemnae]|uniref:Transmembrane protein n=1 Tax=Stylonychia lemnae TaxID=5949 RepID=A0A078A351_STYLE|nr:UNKNOWN [Stylonychia lemnae]|eukprot:CDW75928.1 UNKNOWN [Stylonychia lemnae]